jgi:hypothetical protein
MSQLTEAISQAGVDAVAQAISNDPSFRVFNLLWSDPQEIIPACNKMKWQTLDDLLQWVNSTNTAIGDTAAFEILVDPPVSISTSGMVKVPWSKLHESIHATGLLSSDCLLHNSDGEYSLPTKSQWDTIALACPSSKRKHSGNEELDCDDFVSIARGWLASKGLGNTANAIASTRHFLGSSIVGGHAIVLVWDNTLTPWQWEPQRGLLYPANYAKLGGNFMAQRLEYARVIA